MGSEGTQPTSSRNQNSDRWQITSFCFSSLEKIRSNLGRSPLTTLPNGDKLQMAKVINPQKKKIIRLLTNVGGRCCLTIFEVGKPRETTRRHLPVESHIVLVLNGSFMVAASVISIPYVRLCQKDNVQHRQWGCYDCLHMQVNQPCNRIQPHPASCRKQMWGVQHVSLSVILDLVGISAALLQRPASPHPRPFDLSSWPK